VRQLNFLGIARPDRSATAIVAEPATLTILTEIRFLRIVSKTP